MIDQKKRSNPLNILLPILVIPLIIGGFFLYDNYQYEQRQVQIQEQERQIQEQERQRLQLQLELDQRALEKQRLRELEILNDIMEQRRKIERRREINDSINRLGCLAGNQWQC